MAATSRHIFFHFLVNLLTLSSAEDITSNLCVEQALSFVNEYGNCRTFNADTARRKLRQGKAICKETCEVELTDINQRTTYYLGKVILHLNGDVYDKHMCSFYAQNVEKLFLIRCVSWETGLFFSGWQSSNKVQCLYWTTNYAYACYCKTGYVYVHGICIEGYKELGNTCVSDVQCTGSENSGLCSGGECSCRPGYFTHNFQCHPVNALEAGRCVMDTQCRDIENIQSNRQCVNRRCVCKDGFTLINHTCHEGNLFLNQSCNANEQCSGSPNVSCLGEKCSCIEGYIAVNSTDCVLSPRGLNEAILKTENLESPKDNLRAILGALLGGLLFGIIITTGTVYAVYRRSIFSIHTRRKEPGVMYAANDTFDDGRDEDTFQNNVVTNKSKDKQKKVLNVSPLTRPQELLEYRNTSEKESAMTTMDDVYNHLNEKGETQDEDTYDHACAATTRSHLKDLDDYSNIHNMDDGTTMSGGTENDDYSTLEHN